MQTIREDRFDNPTVEAALYISENFADRAGRMPVNTALEFLAGALINAELNYVIHYNLPSQDVPEPTGVCDEPWKTWSDMVHGDQIEYRAKDTNVLLIDREGGGCGNAAKHPGAACAGAQTFDTYRDYVLEDNTDFGKGFNSLLHEIGHNFGFRHKPHGGNAFNAGGYWHRTPTVGSYDVENHCGEYIEAREHGDAHRYAFYHWCAIKAFEIVDLPIGEPVPEEPPTVTPAAPSEYPPTWNGETINLPDRFSSVPEPISDVYVAQDDLTAEGGENSINVSYRVYNDSEYDVRATVAVSADQTQSETQVTVPAGGMTPTQSNNFEYHTDDDVNVDVCVDVIDARVL